MPDRVSVCFKPLLYNGQNVQCRTKNNKKHGSLTTAFYIKK